MEKVEFKFLNVDAFGINPKSFDLEQQVNLHISNKGGHIHLSLRTSNNSVIGFNLKADEARQIMFILRGLLKDNSNDLIARKLKYFNQPQSLLEDDSNDVTHSINL